MYYVHLLTRTGPKKEKYLSETLRNQNWGGKNVLKAFGLFRLKSTYAEKMRKIVYYIILCFVLGYVRRQLRQLIGLRLELRQFEN